MNGEAIGEEHFGARGGILGLGEDRAGEVFAALALGDGRNVIGYLGGDVFAARVGVHPNVLDIALLPIDTVSGEALFRDDGIEIFHLFEVGSQLAHVSPTGASKSAALPSLICCLTNTLGGWDRAEAALNPGNEV